MKTSLIIHGHFYQPPRENPFIGVVPDQESAAPWTNWNEAVYRTCYRPNAYSRYLSPEGKIIKIRNNYSSISFNMGPSLLTWADREHPHFLEKLKEADKESIKLTGHSGIIAQAFSHTILPLDSKEVRRLDILWAIQDYKKHFRHSPEGFWCPECAVNKEVIDDLYKAGIKFLILSPWQAASINGKALEGKPAPYDRPFLVKGIKHSISVFFYNPDFASGISFGHLLQDADKLYKNLVDYKKKNNSPKLLHWATDGEIYGHHEAFGDMALAALIEKINKNDDFELTNYGAYLEKNPAEETAELYLGDDNKGSSWSCSHGVGRWERDCGCHTGGDDLWNQEWRSPMRQAFNTLEKEVFSEIIPRLSSLLGSSKAAWNVLDSYGRVLCGQWKLESLLSKKVPEFVQTDEKLIEVSSMLDIVRSTVNMFTSCGWFFNDIGGIEPRQNIAYALYAAKGLSLITGKDYQKTLLSELACAKSNLPSVGNGKTIGSEINRRIPARIFASTFFILNRHFALQEDFLSEFGFFKLLSMDERHIEIRNSANYRKTSLTYSAVPNAQHKLVIEIKDDAFDKTYRITSEEASPRTTRIITSWVEKKLGMSITPQTFNSILNSMDDFILLTSNNKKAREAAVYYENIGICIMAIQGQIMQKGSTSWEDKCTAMKQISMLVRNCGIPEFRKILVFQFNSQLKFIARKFGKNGVNETEASNLIKLLRTIREEGFETDITLLQDILYSYISGSRKTDISEETRKNLIDDFNFSPDLK